MRPSLDEPPPPTSTPENDRDATWTLLEQAVIAAHDGECGTVMRIGRQIQLLDSQGERVQIGKQPRRHQRLGDVTAELRTADRGGGNIGAIARPLTGLGPAMGLDGHHVPGEHVTCPLPRQQVSASPDTSGSYHPFERRTPRRVGVARQVLVGAA